MSADFRQTRARYAASKPSAREKHPIAAIQKRVIDSPSFADLSFSARAVLLLLARNLEKDRNGHVQLSEIQAAKNGIERKTLRRAIAELIAHQLVAMTWRGGKVKGACNKYAVLWLPIKERTGIHTDHIKTDPWRDWIPERNKSACRKCPQDSAKNVPLTSTSVPKMSPTPGDKFPPIEVISHTQCSATALGGDKTDRLAAYLGTLTNAGMGDGQHAGRVRAHLAVVANNTEPTIEGTASRSAARKRLAANTADYLAQLKECAA